MKKYRFRKIKRKLSWRIFFSIFKKSKKPFIKKKISAFNLN